MRLEKLRTMICSKCGEVYAPRQFDFFCPGCGASYAYQFLLRSFVDVKRLAIMAEEVNESALRQ